MDYYTQNNKSGDNIMNFGPQPRQLDDNLKSQLLKLLPAGSKIDVTSVMGDGEAFNFAQQITDFLSGNNYKVDGVSQAIYSGPVTGQIVESPKNEGEPYQIIIGNKH
jgi:hypothetical protein